ncbi:hypothetical protein tb265_38810 [Gemmatimonadetes bacterium T265]|nr:hypothetical protein tb265_38810 [Gemmatimonadetes bacterium T265]
MLARRRRATPPAGLEPAANGFGKSPESRQVATGQELSARDLAPQPPVFADSGDSSRNRAATRQDAAGAPTPDIHRGLHRATALVAEAARLLRDPDPAAAIAAMRGAAAIARHQADALDAVVARLTPAGGAA